VGSVMADAREEITRLNLCVALAMTEVREAVTANVFRTQTDFVGRIQGLSCELDDLFARKASAELDAVEFSDQDELDEKLMALGSLCIACAVLCREEPRP
jgi:hypothetical protein